MDPQKPAQLDPKLKEAYERVMGTTVPQPAPQTSPPTTQPTQTVTAAQPVSPSPASPLATTNPPTPVASPKPSATAFVAKPVQRGLGFSFPLPLLVFFVILFLLGYTLFWLKFFKISLPFLPL